MNVGAELREARLRAGLSREDLSQRTKIQLAKIEALEANAFERLPEGIYLDGLIRAYASEVGLDGSEMVARLHRHNALPLEDQIDRETAVVDAVDPLDRIDSMEPSDRIDRADYIVPPPVAVSSTAPTYQPADVAYTTAPPPDPLLHESATHRRRGAGRFVLPLLAVLAAIALGAYLYDRNQPFADRDEIATPAISHENAAEAQRVDPATASRDVHPLPPDAVPADRPASTEHHTQETVEEPAAAAPTPAAAAAPGNPARPSAGAAAGSAPPVTTARESAPSPAPPAGDNVGARREATATSAPARDLSGYWTLDTRVETSNLQVYQGLQLGYRIELQQSGDRISGQGVKTQENGRPLEGRAQTPILVEGTLDGNRLTLTFTERGTRRQSDGKMILDVHEDGVLRGRFASNAARSTGTAEARRPEG